MTGTNFVVANPIEQREALISLNIEYMAWVATGIESCFGIKIQDLLGMPLADYVSGALDKICGAVPPDAVFYLMEIDGHLAGMGGLRRIRPGVAEIKRLYVRPSFRGQQLGDALLRRLLIDARDFGYPRVCLDTAPFMTAAHHLYEMAGFNDCAAYEETEVPTELRNNWRFMDRIL